LYIFQLIVVKLLEVVTHYANTGKVTLSLLSAEASRQGHHFSKSLGISVILGV